MVTTTEIPSHDKLLSEITQLLIREAWVRDNDRFEEWLDFFADKCRYWAPVRQLMDRGKENFHESGRATHFDEDRSGLELRVKRLASGLTFTDEPPARARRMITNVQILESDDQTAKVISYFLMFHSHPGHRDIMAVGYREDRWIQVGRSWKISERMIVLDQDRLPSYLALM